MMGSMKTEAFATQVARWPPRGRHILAQFDEHAVVVYQAYRPSIGRHAATHGDLLGGGFSLDRMSWIKPNFLWMLYRCDPDRGPSGEPLERRAIQLGLRGAMLASYAKPWIVAIEDITPFVREQHATFQRDGRARS